MQFVFDFVYVLLSLNQNARTIYMYVSYLQIDADICYVCMRVCVDRYTNMCVYRF